MGCWGPDLLASDDAMDTLGWLGDRIGIADLYPLHFTDEQAAAVRAALELAGDSLLEDKHLVHGLPVVAATFLATGAALPDRLREEALTAIQADHDEAPTSGWNDGGTGRQAVMVAFKEQVRNHQPGQRVPIEHRGLFATMADHGH